MYPTFYLDVGWYFQSVDPPDYLETKRASFTHYIPQKSVYRKGKSQFKVTYYMENLYDIGDVIHPQFKGDFIPPCPVELTYEASGAGQVTNEWNFMIGTGFALRPNTLVHGGGVSDMKIVWLESEPRFRIFPH